MTAGDDIPPPIPEFRVSTTPATQHTPVCRPAADLAPLAQDMKLPKPLLDYLKKKKITSPSPIQMQGLPVA